MNFKLIGNGDFNMQRERIPWDQYFMLQALVISTRSTCNRLSVGATLVRDKRIIAAGYNGSVSGDDHCLDEGCYLVDGHCVRTIHAEMNAILQCAKFGEATDGAEIYVTDFPCLQCTKMLLQAGIKKITYMRNYHNDPYAQKLIALKHVALNQVTVDPTMLTQLPFEQPKQD
ncbi:deoxycytidylate deaminase [Levilactobacillus parabrevis ATCC 53295]|uniref:ComE operon protein 2 n=2 Tax=Levilactobacillus parabrevis TaxID=357278 RepID=A0A0R1GUX3_9LACO|nr:deoxycytidylate deaminase [Levilactobacillus parabrevis ATCC 53295]KRO06388.1 deoxycytidylate deaminase [Levilactobacillus parabrevis]